MKPPKYRLKATIGMRNGSGISCTWESVIYGLLQYFDDIGLHYIPGREDQSGRLVLEFPSVSEFLRSGMWQVHDTLGFSLQGIWLDTEYCIYLPGHPERPRYGLYSIFSFSDTTGDVTVRELPIVPSIDGVKGRYVKMVYSPEHEKVISHSDKGENQYIGSFTDCSEYFINARDKLGDSEIGIGLSEAVMITNEIYRLDMMTPTEEEHYLKVLEKEALRYVR